PGGPAAHGADQTRGATAPARRLARPAAARAAHRRAARLPGPPPCGGADRRRGGRPRRGLPGDVAAGGGGAGARPGGAGAVRRREGARLPAWLERAEASGVDDLARFATKLREDHAAVQAGLTLRWSNGQTEGQVTKLKLVKRQGYGRAKVDLLRQRVLRAA